MNPHFRKRPDNKKLETYSQLPGYVSTVCSKMEKVEEPQRSQLISIIRKGSGSTTFSNS